MAQCVLPSRQPSQKDQADESWIDAQGVRHRPSSRHYLDYRNINHRGYEMTKDAMFFGGVGIGIAISSMLARDAVSVMVMIFMAAVFLGASWLMRNPSK